MSALTTYQLYIDGAFCDAEGGKTFESINPANGEVWAHMPEASEADVNRAVTAAHRAMTEGPWASMTPTQRGKCLRRLGDLVAESAAHLGEIETTDTGKIIRETRGQAIYVAEFWQYYAGLADKIEGSTLPIDKPDMLVMTLREPIGVVAAVVPWNSQIFLTAVKLGPALAAGNAVVLKGAETGPAPVLEFAKLVDQAGFPARGGERHHRFRRALRPGPHQPPAGRPGGLHRRPRNGAPCGAQHGGELRGDDPGAGRQVALYRVRGRQPGIGDQRCGRRHLRRLGPVLRRRLAPLFAGEHL